MIRDWLVPRLWNRILACLMSLQLLGVTSCGWAKDRVERGKELFTHVWVPNDKLSPDGDGLGPMHNANSCASCHYLGGAGGAGALKDNVDLLTGVPADDGLAFERSKVQSAAIKFHPGFETSSSLLLHRKGADLDYEMWRFEVLGYNSKGLTTARAIERKLADLPPVAEVRHSLNCRLLLSHRNSTSLFGANLIDQIPESVLEEVAAEQPKRFPGIHGRLCRDPSGRVGRFGWRGHVVSLREFVLTACAMELGLQNDDHKQAANPMIKKGDKLDKKDDALKGNDLTIDQCDSLVAFVASLPAPKQIVPKDQAQANLVNHGAKLFETIGCAACHIKDLGNAEGVYSDLLLHDMGADLEDPFGANPEMEKVLANFLTNSAYGGGSGIGTGFVHVAKSSPLRREWKTPPLWGVRDTAPYMHDGRAPTLEAAIAAHGGEGQSSVTRFTALDEPGRSSVMTFLNSLAGPGGKW